MTVYDLCNMLIFIFYWGSIYLAASKWTISLEWSDVWTEFNGELFYLFIYFLSDGRIWKCGFFCRNFALAKGASFCFEYYCVEGTFFAGDVNDLWNISHSPKSE